jgi:hypothetical protein
MNAILALLAAIGAGLGCSNETTPDSVTDAPLPPGLRACTPDGDLGYPGSGVVKCSERFLHRDQALQCRPDVVGVGEQGYPANPGDAASSTKYCFVDADCNQASSGHCLLTAGRLMCAYGCRRDSDCGSGQLCLCGEGLVGSCVAAECRSDADCAAGSLCTGPANSESYVRQHFSCQQASDECAGDSQCGAETFCQFDPELGHKICLGSGPMPGR